VKEIKFGTTTVWKAELDITSQFSVSDYYHPNGAYQRASKSGSSIVLNATSSLLKNIWSTPVDLSSYNTLSITLSISRASSEAGFNATRWFYILANDTNQFVGTFNARSDGLAQPDNPNTLYSRFYGNPRDTEVNTGTRTINVDISTWTGTHKLGLVCACGPSSVFSITVSNVKLQ
jgi:hypothetical protein